MTTQTTMGITITNVIQNTSLQKKDGSNYQATVIQYTNSLGQSQSQTMATAYLSQVPDLANQINALRPGQKVWVTFTQKPGSQFTSWRSISTTPMQEGTVEVSDAPKAKKSFTRGGGSGGGSSYDSMGAAVGQASNAAVLLACHGKIEVNMIKDMTLKIARENMAVLEELKREKDKPAVVTTTAPLSTASTFSDDSIGF